MKPDLILWLGDQLISRIDSAWHSGDTLPELLAPTRILGDFGGATAGVMVVDVKPEFAASVIERRLRSEGMLDHEARVLVHRSLSAGGASRVFYSAIPLPAWQSVFTWLKGEAEIGLLYAVESAMLHAARDADVVVFCTGRQLRLLVSNPDTLIYLTVSSYSEDRDDMQAALSNLVAQFDKQWPLRAEPCTLLWCDLLTAAPGEALARDFARQARLELRCVPAAPVTAGARAMHCAASQVTDRLPVAAALNPAHERVAFFAEHAKTPLAALIGGVGALLLAGAGYLTGQASRHEADAVALQAATAGLLRRNAGMDAPPGQLLAKYQPTMQLIDNVSAAVNSPDAVELLRTLRGASERRVRIMRVRLAAPEGFYLIDGVPAAGASEQSVAGFVAAMRNAGYRIDAVDPGTQTQQPGFFSYQVRRRDSAEGMKP